MIEDFFIAYIFDIDLHHIARYVMEVKSKKYQAKTSS